MKRYKAVVREKFNIVEQENGMFQMFDQYGSSIDSAYSLETLMDFWDLEIIEESDD